MNRTLNASTPAGDALWAVTLDGSEALSELFEFRVGFKSDSKDLDCQGMIGEGCGITLEVQGGGQRYLHGQMVRFGFTGRAGDHWTYEAVVRPRLWHASRRSDCRIWQQKSVPDILSEVLGQNGIAFDLRLKESYRTWEYLTQFRESDLNFISRLMEHEGIYYWFEHSAGSHLMVLGDHFSTHEPYPGYATVPWYPPDATYPDKDHFYAWRLAREAETGKYVHTDYDFKKPPADLTTKLVEPKGHLYDQYEIFDFPGGYTDPAAGQHYAEVRLHTLQVEQDVVFGQGRVRGAAPGYRMTLEKHPRGDQNRELLITRAQYHIADNAYEAAAGSEQNHFEVAIEGIPAQTQFRPRRSTAKPHTLGPETALVVGPPGEEIYTNEHGQVKVKFFWDRYGKKDGTDSCWIRVSHPWAGMNYGGIHIPRIGQEVIVDFLDGDPDYPIITGRVYNADQMPPWELPANKTQSGLLTRSSKGGNPGAGMRDGTGSANAIRFEDMKGAEQLWVHAEKDQLTEVEHDEDKWVGNDRRKEIDRDETTQVHRHRTETVDGNETITVHMNRTETVDQNETITIHQDRTERVDLNEKISIGLNRNEDVGVNETISIGQNRNKTIGVNETDKIGINWSINVGTMKTETIGMGFMQNVGVFKMVNLGVFYNLNVGVAMVSNVGMMMSTIVGVQQSTQVGSKKSLTVGSEYIAEIGKNHTLKVGERKTENVGKVSLTQVGDHLELSCGAAKIVLKSDGGIYLQGTHIEIKGASAINGDAGLIQWNCGAAQSAPAAPAAPAAQDASSSPSGAVGDGSPGNT